MADRFEMRHPSGSVLAGLEPLVDAAFGSAGAGQMMGEQFGLALDEIGEILFEHRGNASVQLLAPGPQQGAVGGVLHQRVLEQVGGVGWDASTEQEARLGQLGESGSQLRFRPLRHPFNQVVAEFAAQDRANLGDFLCCPADAVEPRDQRGVQGRRHRERGQRAREQDRRDPVVLIAAFENRLGQLLDEQRHPVGAIGDLIDDFAAERRVAGEPQDKRCDLTLAEPVQRQNSHMRLAAPGRLKLRPEGNHQQDRQAHDPVDGQIDQLARGRVDPMRVLEHHQDRLPPGQGFQLIQHRVEQLFALALRAQVEFGGGVGQR